MIISFFVRELNINRHFTFEYVIVFIYFVDKNTIDKKIKICFRREIHIVDDLKTNMLIENDIIDLKIFIINLNNKIVRINNCNVIVLIEIRSLKISTIQLSIHLKKLSSYQFMLNWRYSFIAWKIFYLSFVIFYLNRKSLINCQCMFIESTLLSKQ